MSTHETLQPNRFILQPLQETDIPSLLMLEEQAFPLDAWSEESIRKEFSQTPPRFTVIKDGNTVIAYIHTQVGYDDPTFGPKTDGIIESIAVLQGYRRCGLGEKLLLHKIQQLRERGAKRIVLNTRVTNETMIALGIKVGFKPTHIKHNYYPSDNASALEMVYFKGN